MDLSLVIYVIIDRLKILKFQGIDEQNLARVRKHGVKRGHHYIIKKEKVEYIYIHIAYYKWQEK